MRKTLLIALMTGGLALGAVSTYAGSPNNIKYEYSTTDSAAQLKEVENKKEEALRHPIVNPVTEGANQNTVKSGGSDPYVLRDGDQRIETK